MKRLNKKSIGNCYPEKAKLWHPTKNGNLTPYDVTHGSRKIIWWKCSIADDHEWQAPPFSVCKSKKTGCPFCAGLKAAPSNYLTTYPELIEEWDFKRNGNLSSEDIGPGTEIKVHWIYRHNKKHKWPASVSNRTWRNSGCPYCCNRISK